MGDRNNTQYDITVVVATRNRFHSLKDTLDSLVNQQVQRVTYNIIVVDNGSEDGTKVLIGKFQTAYPGRIIYLFEGTKGKSTALNKALSVVESEVVAFTDDDVIVPGYWIQNIFHEFQKTPEVDFIGGPVCPLWLCKKPIWMEDVAPLSMIDFGDSPFIFEKNDSRTVIGANLAVRSRVFSQAGLFDCRMYFWEDGEFLHRIRRMGYLGKYIPHMNVLHRVTQTKATKSFYAKYYRETGKAIARIGFINSGEVPHIKKWQIRLMLSSIRDYFLAVAFSDETKAVGALSKINQQVGFINEILRNKLDHMLK